MVALVTVLAIVALGICIWAVADALSRPTGAFVAAGSNKAMWIALIAVFYFVTGIVGTILAVVYLASIRPRVRAVGG
jgi:hypothetical protein